MKIFENSQIKDMKLRNRLVRSATWEGMCEQDGRPTDRLIECYRDLARGGVGLIITGYTFISPEGKQMPGQMGLHTDSFASEMEKMTRAVHDEGGSICVQLVHAGGQTTAEVAGRRPLAPSSIDADQYQGSVPDEMTQDDIDRITESFGKSAERAKSYGFDAVQLHCSHGYLINQFLSPLTNRRTDVYGGSAENRSRFLLEAYGRVREAVGDDYPVLIKLNGSDNLEGGLLPEEALEAAIAIDKAGVDAIEVSGGTPASGDKTPVRTKILKPESEAYNLDLAVNIKNAVSCPVISVGGFRSYDKVEKSLNGIDYISLARPLIREPALSARWKGGDTSKAKCISCNKCFLAGIKEGGIYCVAEKNEKSA